MKVQLNRIYRKLGITNRTALAVNVERGGRSFGIVARQSGWEHSDNQDGHFGGRGGMMIVAARR